MNEREIMEAPRSRLYERISAEVRQQQFREPTWGHALMVTGRDRQRAIPLYMDLRLEQLRHAEMMNACYGREQ